MSSDGWEFPAEDDIGDAVTTSRVDSLEAPPYEAPAPSSSDAEEPADSGSGSLVRPYTKTGGRTKTDIDFAIETLVVTSDKGKVAGAAQLPEHRKICDLCLKTRSVAEVSAYLRLPLGVTKVLIGDLAGMKLVLIHNNDLLDDGPSIEFMERVLSGLRRL